jgi:hypothetical protein
LVYLSLGLGPGQIEDIFVALGNGLRLWVGKCSFVL